MTRIWTCRRQSRGLKCGAVNPLRNRNCMGCGKPRPATKRPAHMGALDMPYEAWVERFGDVCGICGRTASATRRLDRDHDHRTGEPRGLLCALDNRSLPRHVTTEWLLAAHAYLTREL